MGYKTDGSSHRDGIKNENKLMKKLKQGSAKTLFPCLSDNFTVEKRGGTRHKEDMVIKDGQKIIKISAKRKKNTKIGSFDWTNTTSAVKTMPIFKELKEETTNIKNSKCATSTARSKFNNKSQKTMKEITSGDLKKILKDGVSSKNKDMVIIVSESSTGKSFSWKFKDSPLYDSIENHTPRLSWGRGKTSAKVVFEDENGNILDHNIRIRVVLNNGAKALMGRSKTNKSSTPSVKIQQDKVNVEIKKLIGRNIITQF